MTLLDPSGVFTPLTGGVLLLASLCGLGIAIFVSQIIERRRPRDTTTPVELPVSKAA